jgi:hypothetical protein
MIKLISAPIKPIGVLMKRFVCLLGLVVAGAAFAGDVFRIEVGKDYNRYSDSDLRRRVWELERAVEQLQARVFNLEAKPVEVASWICSIRAMGDNFTGTGATKAVATAKVMEACKQGRKGDTFFCKDPTCEQ